MHYYKFNIGDYQSHTAHLEPLEDIAYRRMIDWCYLHEKPLPPSIEEISRLIRMRSHSDCIANVLREFFIEHEDGYFCKRIEKEIEAYNEKSEKAKASAEARWLKTKKKIDNANALQTESECNANQEPLTINQEPDNTCEKQKSTPAKQSVPFQAIIDLYHEMLPSLPRMLKLTTTRKGYIRQRWIEDMPELDNWRNFFDHVSQSDFLMGRVPGREGKPPFRADLEWITKPSNFAKIAERKYDV